MAFETNIIKTHGNSGIKWLENLPRLIDLASIKYGLSELIPFTNLSYNYVLRGYRDKNPVVLKLGFDRVGLRREAIALRAFAGYRAARIIAEDEGILLLEQATPGGSLKSFFPNKDDQAIQITSTVIQKLHQAPVPTSPNFPNVKEWLSCLDKNWPLPARHMESARLLRDRLLQTSAKEVLLHGDLHHDNILQNGANWLVIDPKGVIGEPAYEAAAFIRNPLPNLIMEGNPHNIICNRITRFAEILKFPPGRILDWCFTQSVLAWVWALEDGGDAGYFQVLTKIFKEISLRFQKH